MIEDNEIKQVLEDANQKISQDYEPDSGIDEAEHKEGRLQEIIKSYVLPVLWGIMAALILTQVMFFLAVVPTGSMETTILTGDRIAGNRMVYWFQEPTYGEIVVFWSAEYNEFMVKRVIGCPGDTVEIMADGVYVNGRKISDAYTQGRTTELHMGQSAWQVPEDSYFLMGDNRENSADSRYWNQPYVPDEEIYARYMFRYSLGKNGWYLDWNDPISFWEESGE